MYLLPLEFRIMLPLNKINNVPGTKAQRKDDFLPLTELSQELTGRLSFGEFLDATQPCH